MWLSGHECNKQTRHSSLVHANVRARILSIHPERSLAQSRWAADREIRQVTLPWRKKDASVSIANERRTSIPLNDFDLASNLVQKFAQGAIVAKVPCWKYVACNRFFRCNNGFVVMAMMRTMGLHVGVAPTAMSVIMGGHGVVVVMENGKGVQTLTRDKEEGVHDEHRHANPTFSRVNPHRRAPKPKHSKENHIHRANPF